MFNGSSQLRPDCEESVYFHRGTILCSQPLVVEFDLIVNGVKEVEVTQCSK